MKHIIRFAIVTVLSSALSFAAAPKKEDATAKTPAKTDKPAAKGEDAKPMHLPLKGMVLAITTRTLTVKGGEGKEDRKFTINKETQILKGEAAATVADVKVGQTITGSFIKNAEGASTLTKLQIAPKTAEPKKPAAKGEESKTKKADSDPKKKTS